MSSAICFNLDQSKMLSSGNGLSGSMQPSLVGEGNYSLHGVKISSMIILLKCTISDDISPLHSGEIS